MRSLLLVAFLLCITLATANVARIFPEGAHSTSLSPQWRKDQECPPHQKIDLIFAIKQQNLVALEDLFWRVSDPTSNIYGKFMTAEKVGDLVQPSKESIAVVVGWLEEHGVTDYVFTPHKEFVKAFVNVSVASELLGGIKYHYFTPATATTSQLRFARSLDAYSLPAHVAAHVDFVGGVNRLPKLKTLKARKLVEDTAYYGGVDPAIIKQVFNITTAVGKSPKNLQGVAQFLGQFFTPSDLTDFQQQFSVPVQAVTKVYGPNDASNPGIEASLDIEYIMGVANNVPTWFISTAGEHEGQEPFLEWILNMTTLGNAAPYVISVSYGDTESSITVSYATRVSVEFQKYGLTGRSIIFASGDDGVGCNTQCTQFEPNWPASSPYVTAVGGTILDNANTFSIESDPISSGGFSNYFDRPKYQDVAVNKYLNSASNLPPSSFYHQGGRAIPDVSSFSEDVTIVYQGGSFGVGGTSCAAPVFGAVVSLINDLRLTAGKSTLGFLNPILYSVPSAFLDITTGSANSNGCCNGFPAAVGWDAITGLGVPNYPALAKALA